ncbi:MAG: hypothetical protein OSJ72_14815 [Lachnospiraceae bacterium]|nr:hypothetical protein [Lachnospiraceae bacterium]
MDRVSSGKSGTAHTYQRVIAPLKAVRDHYPKYIVTMDEVPMEEDGIRQINVSEFLLQSRSTAANANTR